ncbi:MAG: hypothetical protein H6550_15925 [Chitinophagales bacterium]|nr:hypothetical protein [Chitinophagales bacterium]
MADIVTLSIDNLYANAKLYDSFGTGEQLLLRDKVVFTPSVDDKWHTLVDGDRLDLIAWRMYKGKVTTPHRLWWVIADANNIHNPFDLSDYVGKALLIPAYENIRIN